MDSENHTQDLISSGKKKTVMVKTIMYVPGNKFKISFFNNQRKIFKKQKLWLSLLFIPIRLATSAITFVHTLTYHGPGIMWQEMQDCPQGFPICPYHIPHTVGRGAICVENLFLNSCLLPSFFTLFSAFLHQAKK